jgi:hypothetical protein
MLGKEAEASHAPKKQAPGVQRQRYAIGDDLTSRERGSQASNRAYMFGMEHGPKGPGRQRERTLIAEPWCKQDLFFMENTLRRGASFRDVAGFLSRPEGEVRAKAIELGIHEAEEPCAPRIKRSAH